MIQAYLYAYQREITTMQTIDQANMYSHLTRAQAAKMLSQFAIQVLEKEPDTTKSCSFPDIGEQKDLIPWIRTSCQL